MKYEVRGEAELTISFSFYLEEPEEGLDAAELQQAYREEAANELSDRLIRVGLFGEFVGLPEVEVVLAQQLGEK